MEPRGAVALVEEDTQVWPLCTETVSALQGILRALSPERTISSKQDDRSTVGGFSVQAHLADLRGQVEGSADERGGVALALLQHLRHRTAGAATTI